MRAILLVGLALIASCVASPAASKVEPQLYYHDAVGFDLAARIKVNEEAAIEKLLENAIRGEPVESTGNRIVGGAAAASNSYPFLAGLIISFVNVAGQSVCGSSLLSANRLVTAAHCWFDGRNQARQYEVVLGSQFIFFGGTRVHTQNVIMHPQWTPATLANDVAMIYLPTNVLLSQSIQPVALPSDLHDTFAGQWAMAAGYGRTSDQQTGITMSAEIFHVNLQIITVQQCMSVFGPTFVQQSTLCTSGAGGVGICGGDSGGPLVVTQFGQRVLVGISSFVNAAGCQLGSPSAFARVTSFHSFIQQHM
ncbi:brachyurin-like [Hyposmocoma kahamanoa]|uniref:brachyurin-like n=1 Tax=Hyposmocoma kahamanoa TaxID=1477025 RepID=UPI000E6D9E02|nr:brachyurin-like [Hyposmocoma kahamanoa]